ncbi:hypothetical protein OH77DRAFT_1109000 [Trametes cingulata]|nr:hypothetical protein OH77DRAFT_1109000 [Trametes cingulata]
MNFSPSDLHSYWDISAQQPDTFSALPDDDFLAFLQKQFPTAVGNNPPLSFDNPDGVDPQSISSFPPLNNSPPSSDSSPSPPSTHHESSLSRRQSGAFNDPSSSASTDQQKGQQSQQQSQQEDGTLKRKAANDNEDEPQHKSQHTASSSASTNKKGGSTSSRRKSGTPQDESRLLKRKEQNRAAQRAFRERKERHVKDLEDKVAALEAKNHMTEQENENLRDLLQRLQNENMMLKQAAFTFTAPHGNVGNATASAQSSAVNNHMQFNFATPGAGPSKSPVQSQQPQQPQQQFDLNFNSLIPFDPNMLNPAEDFGEDMNMNVDSAFPYNNGTYKTIASNPLFTSFAEPSPGDSPPLLVNGGHHFTPGSFDSFTEHWTPPESQDALEQLFGANFLSPNANSVTDFQALLASSPSSISPVSHASMRTPSLSSASSSPDGATGTASPQTANGSPALHHMGECPKTKAELSKVISESGQSSFVQSPPPMGSPSSGTEKGSSGTGTGANGNSNAGPACEMAFAPVLKKAVDDNGTGPIVMCKGSSFPRTEKSDKNVEVLTAWRSITSNPQFKDVDINELCSEFTSKARCDGTKVVLEPEGVHHIIETLAAKQAQAQAQAHK